FRILTIGRANGRKTTILQGVCNTHDNPEIRNGAGEKVHLMTLVRGWRLAHPHQSDPALFKASRKVDLCARG
ncbi:hypothetical protein CY34DRAFT_100937, partial [Suillus luteus UH-Slu-Lm8-n1]